LNKFATPEDRTWQAAPRGPPEAGLNARPVARVLIVDDDERNAFAAVQALEDLGHELVVARSGEEALRCLLDDDFAVILLDLHMPGMDGYETAALIRERKRTRSIPIVFLTAIFRDEAHVFQAYSAGAVDVVFKPVDPFILRSKVSVLVDLHIKTEEMKREAAYRQWLLTEHSRVQAEKLSAEQALSRSRARQEWILRALPIVFHSRSPEPPFAALFVSDGVETITGFSPEAFTGSAGFGLERVHADDRERVAEALSGAQRTGAYSCEYRWLCADGEYRHLLDQGVLALSEDGKSREIFGAILDVTERRSLEEQLTQARKMEAVGQLTGGVAHDFNNLLTVVLGNVDFLTTRAEAEERRARRIDAVRQAAERGRDLTRQLLAFSRRQNLNPVTLDVDALIDNFAPLLRQAVGEAVTVEIIPAPRPLYLHADPAHLETALLNLAVNARDAMPEGGVLSIATTAVAADDGAPQVCISVSDTGMGMAPDVRDRIFEPFFTTKELGYGSGLGLSQVYGFVRQSNGNVVVESEPGQGACIRLVLPASSAPAEAMAVEEAADVTMVGGTETVLVVDDDPAVLSLTVDMLSGLGYRIITATNAAEALEVIGGDTAIDLLFSDVVMPGGASGVSLARKAQELRPALKVLLTSGYVGDGAPFTDSPYPLIDKPYQIADLAQDVRRLLDEASPVRPRRSRRRKAVPPPPAAEPAAP
jgi:PAS domain S-box-containing protein